MRLMNCYIPEIHWKTHDNAYIVAVHSVLVKVSFEFWLVEQF
jgi:hypothetical protein